MRTITTGGEAHRMKKGSGQGTAPFYGQAGEGDYRRIRNADLFRRLFKDGEGMSAEEYRMKWSQWVK